MVSKARSQVDEQCRLISESLNGSCWRCSRRGALTRSGVLGSEVEAREARPAVPDRARTGRSG